MSLKGRVDKLERLANPHKDWVEQLAERLTVTAKPSGFKPRDRSELECILETSRDELACRLARAELRLLDG